MLPFYYVEKIKVKAPIAGRLRKYVIQFVVLIVLNEMRNQELPRLF